MTNLRVTHTRWIVIQYGCLVCALVLITTFALALKADASDVIGGKCSTEGQTLPIGNLTARCSKIGNELKWLEVRDLSYDGCDPELDWQPTWRDCTRSFDAGTPQKIRKQINAAGLACVKPKSLGRGSYGSRFLECTIGGRPIAIMSFPKGGYWGKFRDQSGTEYKIRRSYLTGFKCKAINLSTPRYYIYIPAVDSTLKLHEEFVVSIRRALGIPRFSKKGASDEEWFVGADGFSC